MSSLAECVAVAAASPEYVENWMRLRGISLPRTVIEHMVDDAVGRNDAIAQLFIADVHELIYSRLPEPSDV